MGSRKSVWSTHDCGCTRCWRCNTLHTSSATWFTRSQSRQLERTLKKIANNSSRNPISINFFNSYAVFHLLFTRLTKLYTYIYTYIAYVVWITLLWTTSELLYWLGRFSLLFSIMWTWGWQFVISNYYSLNKWYLKFFNAQFVLNFHRTPSPITGHCKFLLTVEVEKRRRRRRRMYEMILKIFIRFPLHLF